MDHARDRSHFRSMIDLSDPFVIDDAPTSNRLVGHPSAPIALEFFVNIANQIDQSGIR